GPGALKGVRFEAGIGMGLHVASPATRRTISPGSTGHTKRQRRTGQSPASRGASSQGNAGPLPSFLDPLGGPDAKRQVWGRSVLLRLAPIAVVAPLAQPARQQRTDQAAEQ